MRNVYFGLIGMIFALFIVGCGKGGSGSKSSSNGNVCAAGLVNTQYGCLQQGNCPAGQAQYNNGQCVAATQGQQCTQSGYMYSSQVGQCLPQGNCQYGQVQYQNQCLQADNNYNNGGWNNNGWNNNGWNYQYQYQYGNPYLPQQNYNYYWSNPFYNPYWTPQYYYYGW